MMDLVAEGQFVPEDPPQPDDKAVAEADAIAAKSLKKRYAEARQTHLHMGGVLLFWVALVAMVLTGMVWL